MHDSSIVCACAGADVKASPGESGRREAKPGLADIASQKAGRRCMELMMRRDGTGTSVARGVMR